MGSPSLPGRGIFRVFGALLFVALFLPEVLVAQSPRWQLDLNGSRIRYDTLEALNAPSVAALVEWEGLRFLGRLGGSVTGFENNGHSFQGRGDLVGWFSPAGTASPMRLEVSSGLAGSRHSSGFGSFAGQSDVRLHVQRGRYGGWLGIGGAVAKNTFDVDPLSSVAPNGGAWVQVGPTRLVARYADTRVEADRFPELTVSAAYSRGSVDATAFAGYRGSPFAGVDDDSWVGASVAWWFTPGAALLLSGGQYAPDVIQGLPGGDFASLGIRVAPTRRRPVAPSAPLPLLFTRESARRGGLGFQLPGASQVEVAGDWTGWQLVPLEQASDGRWVLPAELEPGVYRFNLRVDGERWIVPDGLPTVEDGFGGQVGLLVISGS